MYEVGSCNLEKEKKIDFDDSKCQSNVLVFQKLLDIFQKCICLDL